MPIACKRFLVSYIDDINGAEQREIEAINADLPLKTLDEG